VPLRLITCAPPGSPWSVYSTPPDAQAPTCTTFR
jgi:hypothetical protein